MLLVGRDGGVGEEHVEDLANDWVDLGEDVDVSGKGSVEVVLNAVEGLVSEFSGLIVSDVRVGVLWEGVNCSQDEGVHFEVGNEGLGEEVNLEGNFINEVEGQFFVSVYVQREHEWIVSSKEHGFVEVDEVWIDFMDVDVDGVLGISSVVFSEIWEDCWDLGEEFFVS